MNATELAAVLRRPSPVGLRRYHHHHIAFRSTQEHSETVYEVRVCWLATCVNETSAQETTDSMNDVIDTLILYNFEIQSLTRYEVVLREIKID